MPTSRWQGIRTWAVIVGLLSLAVAATASPVRAQERYRGEDAGMRREVGLRGGTWDLTTRSLPNSAVSAWPMFEAYYQTGMGRHLATETSIGLFRRNISATDSAGLLNVGTRRITSYIVPLMVNLKYYPFTTPGALIQPFLRGGVGFTLGFDNTYSTGGPLGPGTSTSQSTGLGLRGGAGLEIYTGHKLGLIVSGGYMLQWFGAQLGGVGRTYKGVTVLVGLTYHL